MENLQLNLKLTNEAKLINETKPEPENEIKNIKTFIKCKCNFNHQYNCNCNCNYCNSSISF